MNASGGTLGGLRVLVVEDEALVAQFLEELLTTFGCNVAGIAANTTQAMSFIETEGADLHGALLDINLDGEPVYPLAERLGELQLPYAFVTSYDDDAIDPRFSRVPVLHKPFRPLDLASLVASIAIRR
jgi:CheY-like chemotaxis protein